MRKLIITISSVIVTILLICIIYLSIYGIKTDNFNTFINNKVKDYNSNLTLKLNDVFIKLNLNQPSLNINTKNAILLADNNSLKILNIDINLNALKFIKKENSIKNIKIETSENSIKDLTSLLNSINYDLSRFIFYSQIKNGLIKFKLDTKLAAFLVDLLKIKYLCCSFLLINFSIEVIVFPAPITRNILGCFDIYFFSSKKARETIDTGLVAISLSV